MQFLCVALFITLTWVYCQAQFLIKNQLLPDKVRLGGVNVDAVEQDIEQQEQELAQKDQVLLHFWRDIDEHSALPALVELFNETSMVSVRGKHHKQKKLLKHLYPLVMGILLAKTVLIPLTLKVLIAMSASSFVMSKIALAASALLALKWILGGQSNDARDRLEIYHVPVFKSMAEYGQPNWNDLDWSGSQQYYENNNKNHRNKYIPLQVGKESTSYTAAQDAYRYPQHNYNAHAQRGKPFL